MSDVYVQVANRSGKSLQVVQEAVKRSAETGQAVAVFTEVERLRILEEAARQGVQIPEPVIIKIKREKSVRGVTFAGILTDY